MGRLCKLLLCLSAAFAGGWCLWPKRPYAGDPLLHNGRGVWGDRDAARKVENRAPPEPEPPQPPNVPESIDPFLAGGQARPVTLP